MSITITATVLGLSKGAKLRRRCVEMMLLDRMLKEFGVGQTDPPSQRFILNGISIKVQEEPEEK